MKNIKSQYLYPVLLTLSVTILFSGCSSNPDTDHSDEDHHLEESIIEFTRAQFDQVGINIGKAEKRNIGSDLKVNGVIDVPPHGNISINVPYGGFLKNTKMLPGTIVKKGQIIATIENPDFIHFQQQYQQYLAQREFLKAEYERQEALFKDQIASGKNYQQAKSTFESNEVRIRAMEEKLKLIGFDIGRISGGKTTALVNIYSPVSGSVKEVYANVGKYIGREDVIMDITDTRDLHVELSVYENDIPKISNGQRIRFTIAGSVDLVREAEVFLIGKNIREDRSVTIHGHLISKEEDLLPGMYVSARIITGTNEVWAVGEEAVVRFQGKHYVYSFAGQKQEDNQAMYQFEMMEVIKGIEEDGYVQIDFADNSLSIDSYEFATSGAFHILSKSKNSEQEGHAH